MKSCIITFFIFVFLLSAHADGRPKAAGKKASKPIDPTYATYYCHKLGGMPISQKKLDAFVKNGTAPAYSSCDRRLKDPKTLEEVANSYRNLHVDHLNNMVMLLGSIKTDLFQSETEKKIADIEEKLRPQPKSTSKIALGLLKDLAKEIPFFNLGKELVGPLLKWGGHFHSMYELYNSLDPSSPFYNEKASSVTSIRGIINHLTNTIQAVKSQFLTLEALDTVKCQFAYKVPKGQKDPHAETCKYLPENIRGTLSCEDYVNMQSFDKHKADKNRFLASVAKNVAKEVPVDDPETGTLTPAMIEVDIPMDADHASNMTGTQLVGKFKFSGHMGETMLCQMLQDPKFWNGDQLNEFASIESLGLPLRLNFRFISPKEDSIGHDIRLKGKMTAFAYRNMNGEIPAAFSNSSNGSPEYDDGPARPGYADYHSSYKFGWKLGHADTVEVFKDRESNHLGKSGPVFRTDEPPTSNADTPKGEEKTFELDSYKRMQKIVKHGNMRELEKKIPIRSLAPKCKYQQH